MASSFAVLVVEGQSKTSILSLVQKRSVLRMSLVDSRTDCWGVEFVLPALIFSITIFEIGLGDVSLIPP